MSTSSSITDTWHQQDWRTLPFVAVDVETTGLDPESDRIIEIAVVLMQNGEVVDRYESLVNPGISLPEEVEKITGISQDDLKDAPSFASIATTVFDKLGHNIFLAYNLPFDRAFIKNELQRVKIDWSPAIGVDPLIFVRELHKNQGSKRLGAVAERLGIHLENAHRAGDDATVAGKVLFALEKQLPPTLNELRLLQQQWAEQQRNEMASWRKKDSSAFDESLGDTISRGNSLGPAYVYGEQTDPVRAMFLHLPDSGGRK